MKLDVLREARKVWQEISMDGVVDDVALDAQISKQLLDFFHVGRYYHYLFDVMNARFRYVSPEIGDVLGYDPQDWTIEKHFAKVHPEDLPFILDFEKAVVDFFRKLPNDKITKYKFSYDFRILNHKGEYTRLHQQVTTLQFNPGHNVLITFGVHTDITNFKKNGIPTLSFLGLDSEPSYINVDVTKTHNAAKKLFTKREREILLLLLSGHQSTEIAEMLCISKFTVDTHRKHLLAKTKCKSSMEMAAKIVREGLV